MKQEKKRYLLMIFLIVFLGWKATTSYGIALVGTQKISFTIPHTERTLIAEIYYPTDKETDLPTIDDGIWRRKNFEKEALRSSRSTLYPLVIFSHGWKGDRFGNSWIAEELVAQGYIVVMIDHTHNTSYEHNDLFTYTSLWQRPMDMSQLLTYLLNHPQWGKVIDQDKIAAGGFSLGGLTALWLGGIEGDEKRFKEAMDQSYTSWNGWSQSEKEEVERMDWVRATYSYYDPRIKAVFALAPDLGKGFKPQGLHSMKVPALIVVGDQDQRTPAKDNADFYAAHIPHASLLTVKEAEHFSFMNKCSKLGEQRTPHLCRDNTDREAIHKEVSLKIIEFLNSTLT